MGIGGELRGDCRGFNPLQDRYRLPTGESGLDFMPVGDGFFAKFPAEADIVSAMAADEIDEAHLIVLQIATDFVQLVDVVLEVFDLPSSWSWKGG